MILIIGSRLETKPNPDSQSTALFYTIIHTLKPGEAPVLPFVQKAPPVGIYAAILLFDTSFLVSLFVATFAMLLQPCLNRYLLSDSGTIIERQEDLKRWRFDLFVRALRVMILVPLLLLLCGLWKRFG